VLGKFDLEEASMVAGREGVRWHKETEAGLDVSVKYLVPEGVPLTGD